MAGKKKLRVGIVFGGRSAEHEVSVRSAQNVYNALDPEKYEPVLIGITKQGSWLFGQKQIQIPGGEKTTRALVPHEKEIAGLDVVFPILHGPYGEDGTIQGLLKMAHIPFVGAGVLGSAVGMDKDVMKRLLRDAGMPIGKFRVITKTTPVSYATVVKELGMPLFVKPANLGSSVGVSKVKNKKEYAAALEQAFSYDRKVIVEEFIEGREVECSVLGNDTPIASVVGEIVAHHEFYSYEAKYIDEKGAELKIPADISQRTSDRIRKLAVKTFLVLECAGLARVDFFLTKTGTVLVNEINTLPGFTSISMYPQLWRASGIPYAQLVDRLIQLALERHETEQKLVTSYIPKIGNP